RSAVDEIVAPGRDHLRRRRIADETAEAELTKSGRRHLGVGDRAIVRHHDLRSDDRLSRPTAPRASAVSVIPELVWLSLENVEQLLVDVPPTVVPDIDDDSLLLPEAIDLVLEALERRLVHRADVDVRDLAVRRLLDGIAIGLDPLLVLD